ncbi:MAG: SUMF1/EgtB/PvdO family nonheme iron enzyme, partial [Phycisphaerae bacterium]|nr:SUMF1/EgtB/PvdO family nonheme iron enzyme [Phycisphaerae bacterium]
TRSGFPSSTSERAWYFWRYSVTTLSVDCSVKSKSCSWIDLRLMSAPFIVKAFSYHTRGRLFVNITWTSYPQLLSATGTSYGYRIGKYEVTNAQWNTFTAAAGAPTGNGYGYDLSAYFTGAQQPTNNVSWYEAAQFCNYLTSGDKSKGAYQFSGNNSNPGDFSGINRDAAISSYDIAYVIPTEDEWYKAAYFKPNGSGYSLYANGLNTIPAADNGWNYSGGSYNAPWDVGSGIQEQNTTFDMMGNVYEWNETPIWDWARVQRGGSYYSSDVLSSSYQAYGNPLGQNFSVGFRVASVDEPTVVPVPGAVLLGAIGLLYSGLRLRRRTT